MTQNEADRSDIREHLIEASPDAVFAVISDPLKLAKWWGPDGFTNTFERFDFVESGKWNFTMHGPDGKDYWNENAFVEIVPNRRIVIEHLLAHHFFLTLSLEPAGAGTLVGWKQQFDTPEHYQEIAGFVAEANQQNLLRMEAVIFATDTY